jgi:DNA topoisomerase-1
VGSKLIIVESPAKAKTIQNFLGEEFKVVATKGHIRDLPEKRFGIKIEGEKFIPQYQITKNHKDIVKELKKIAKNAEQIYIATDEDREGEAIGYHVTQLLGKDIDEVERIVFHEITPSAIKKALENPRKIDLNRVNAQQTRRLLDRIVGYKLSPLLAKKIQRGLSAGRVQSATLKLVVDREREIQNFVPKPYYTIEGIFKGSEGKLVKWRGKTLEKFSIGSREEAEEILSQLKDKTFHLTNIQEKTTITKAPPPFMTSTLQQVASSELGFSPRKTMEIAQRLYEGVETPIGKVGLITYMRTDSLHLAPEAREEAVKFIEEKFGKEYAEPKEFKTKSKTAQEAHEAIRPTHIELTPESLKKYLSRDDLKLYQLIFNRFIASQMKGAQYQTTKLFLEGGDGVFKIAGRKLTFPGFYKIYGEPSPDIPLPPIEKGEEVKPEKLEWKEHFTKPPERYTEAMLIKKMEELGIGRPSTYAPTITLLKKRGYIDLLKKKIHPTENAFKVIELLEKHFPNIVDSHFTANMEEMLDRIASGQEEWQKVLKEFYFPFVEQIKQKEKEIPSQKVQIPIGEKCPLCGGELLLRKGRFGEFIGCSNFPKCRYTRPKESKPKEPKKIEGVHCPDCGGDIVVRRGRSGEFYGCSNYPNCHFTTSHLPIAKCPSCGHLAVKKESKKGEITQCLQCKEVFSSEKGEIEK